MVCSHIYTLACMAALHDPVISKQAYNCCAPVIIVACFLCRLSIALTMGAPKATTSTHLEGTPICPPPFPNSYPHLFRLNPSTLSPIRLNCHPLWHNLRHNLIWQKPFTVLPVNTGLPQVPPRLAPTPGPPPPPPPSVKPRPSLMLCPLGVLHCNSPLQVAKLSSQLSRKVILLCIRLTTPIKANLRALRRTSPRAPLCISPMKLSIPPTTAM